MPRKAKKKVIKKKPSTSSSEDSDDSFDEEDEVPLSQLIPQVKKDLAPASSVVATKSKTTKDKTRKSSKSETEESADKGKEGNAGASTDDDATAASPEERSEIGDSKSAKKDNKPDSTSSKLNQKEEEDETADSPTPEKNTDDKQTATAAAAASPETKNLQKPNTAEKTSNEEEEKPGKDDGDEDEKGKATTCDKKAEVEAKQEDTTKKAALEMSGAVENEKESTDMPTAKKGDAKVKVATEASSTETKDEAKVSVPETLPPAGRTAAVSGTVTATNDEKVVAEPAQKGAATEIDTKVPNVKEAVSIPTIAEEPVETKKKEDTAAPMEVDEGVPSTNIQPTSAATKDSSNDNSEKAPKDESSNVPAVEENNKEENAMNWDKQEQIVEDEAKVQAVEALSSKDMDVDVETKEVALPVALSVQVKDGQANAKATVVKPPPPAPSPPPKPVYVPEQWAVEVESEDEEGTDPFQAFTKTENTKRGKSSQRSTKTKPLKIKITTTINDKDTDMDGAEGNVVVVSSSDESSSTSTTTGDDNIYKWLEEDRIFVGPDEIAALVEEEIQDSLDFFQEPHEDQDEAYSKFQKDKKKVMLKEEIRKLEDGDKTGRRQIEIIINDLLKNKQASTDRSIENYKAKAVDDEKRDMRRLQQIYTAKTNQNQEKINQGMMVLRKRHQQETQKVLQQHRQQAQQRRLPEQVANAEWHNVSQRLRVKQQRQLQDFSAKGEEVKRRCESDYKRDSEKIRNQYEKKKSDIDRKAIYSRMHHGFNQLRQQYLKRNIQRILKEKEGLMQSLRELEEEGRPSSPMNDKTKESKYVSARGKVNNSMVEDKADLRPAAPIKTCGRWYKESVHEKSGAAARHKHRKGILSHISKQLSVEIHNEGIWVYQIKRDDEANKSSRKDDSKQTTASEEKFFIPWGVKARDLLDSLICGEIPKGYGSDRFDWDSSVLTNGGHIRCVMTDLRTSEETASLQRATAVTDKELAELGELQKKVKELAITVQEAERNLAKHEKQDQEITPKVQEAIKDAEQKRIGLQNFRNKFSRYLGPDGKPLPTTNPTDRQRLIQATVKYKQAVETSEKREKAGRAKLGEIKGLVQQHSQIVMHSKRAAAAAASGLKKKRATLTDMGSNRARASREAEEASRVSTRVKDVMTALRFTASKRRDQLNQKRNSATSSTWVQNFPGLPSPLRRSLWCKMHRRRQQIVLRPPIEYALLDLRGKVAKTISEAESSRKSSKIDGENEILDAERKLLLAMHPTAEKDAAKSSLPSSSSWAEPGWQLVLDVPKPGPKTILPRTPVSSLLQKNLSEIHSAPGRQAACLVRSTDLRSLAAPLSAVGKVTSLAETAPSSNSSAAKIAEIDPLHTTKEASELGYKFSIKLAVTKRPNTNKKSSTDQASGKKVDLPSLKSMASAQATKKRKAPGGNEGATKRVQRRKPVKVTKAQQQQKQQFQQQQQQQQQVPNQYMKPMQLPTQTPQTFFQQPQQQPAPPQQQYQAPPQQPTYPATTQQQYQPPPQQFQAPQQAQKPQYQVPQQQQFQAPQQQFQAPQPQQPQYQAYQQFGGTNNNFSPQQQQQQQFQSRQQQQMQFQMMQQQQQQQQQGVTMPQFFHQQSFGQQQMQQPMQPMQQPQPPLPQQQDDQKFDPLFMLGQ